MNNELAKRANKVIEDLQQENTNLKMQIDDLVKKYENEIKNSDEQTSAWQEEKSNSSDNDYKEYCLCIIEREKEARCVYRKVIDDLSKLKEVKK